MAGKQGHGGTHFTSWAQELQKITTQGNVGVESLAFSSDNTLLAAAVGSSVCLLSAALEQKLELPDAHAGAIVHCVAFAGGSLISGGADGNIRLWDVRSGEQLGLLEGHQGDVLGVAVALGNNDILATSSVDCTVMLWRHGLLEQTLTEHEGPVFSVAFSRDGSLLVSASADQTARVWRLEDGSCVAILRGHKAEVRKACFGSRRTAAFVVTGSSDGTALLWQLPKLRGTTLQLTPLHACKAHSAGINDIAIGENGETLCTVSNDKSLKLWTLRDGAFARSLTGGGCVAAVAFSTAGAAKVASATSSGAIKLWGIVPRGRESGMFA